MKREDDQELWDLLGKAEQPPVVSPFFARNVLREIRQRTDLARSIWHPGFRWRRLIPVRPRSLALVTAAGLALQRPATDRSRYPMRSAGCRSRNSIRSTSRWWRIWTICSRWRRTVCGRTQTFLRSSARRRFSCSATAAGAARKRPPLQSRGQRSERWRSRSRTRGREISAGNECRRRTGNAFAPTFSAGSRLPPESGALCARVRFRASNSSSGKRKRPCATPVCRWRRRSGRNSSSVICRSGSGSSRNCGANCRRNGSARWRRWWSA